MLLPPSPISPLPCLRSPTTCFSRESQFITIYMAKGIKSWKNFLLGLHSPTIFPSRGTQITITYMAKGAKSLKIFPTTCATRESMF